MFTELAFLQALVGLLRSRLAALREAREAGYSTEAVLVIAGLVAVAAIAVTVTDTDTDTDTDKKIVAKAKSIDLG